MLISCCDDSSNCFGFDFFVVGKIVYIFFVVKKRKKFLVSFEMVLKLYDILRFEKSIWIWELDFFENIFLKFILEVVVFVISSCFYF